MKYCKTCLQPDTRPAIRFNEEGICGACLWEKEKATIDWKLRETQLKQIAENAKIKAKEKGSPYDCVIGVSGGKDSTFQALYSREKLGLHILLVNSVPENLTEIGSHNINNLVEQGFDIIQMRSNPKIMKSLTKRAFYEYGNPVKPSEYTLWASAYIIALKFGIPLIIQGENSALTLGTAVNSNEDDNALLVTTINTLSGGNATDWADQQIPLRELYLYQFPHEIKQTDIRAIYLQYYLKEWSQVGNADYSIARGLWGRMKEDLHSLGRYRRFTSLDSDIVIVNQMLKYLKFGFGFATDEAGYDIREGRLSREDAIWYVTEYDGLCGEKYIEDFCRYSDISVEEFWRVTDRFVNKKLFQKDVLTKRWIPKFTVGTDFKESD